MAGKSPAELKSEGEELKLLFAKIKKKQHNCAILMSKDGVVIEAHIKKSPEILVKAAKKNGGMAKGAWGTILMEGQIAILDPINEKIPGNLGKLAKKFFTERGLKIKLQIKEPDEEAAEAGAEQEEETSASGGQAPAADTEETSSVSGGDENTSDDGEGSSSASGGGEEGSGGGDNKRAELEQRQEAIQDSIDELTDDRENVMFSAFEDALRAHERAMEAEEFDRAAETMSRLESVMEDYEGLMADKRPLMARMDAMERDAQRVIDGEDPIAAEEVAKAKRAFVGAIDNNEWFGAAAQLDKIQDYVDAAGGSSQEEEQEEEDGSGSEETAETTETSENENQSGDANPEDLPEVDVDLDEVKAETDELKRKELKERLEANKKELNGILKNKDSENGRMAVEALTAYSKAEKGGKFPEAEDALDKVEEVLEKARSEFSLTDNQRAAIMKELDKMEAEIDALESEAAE